MSIVIYHNPACGTSRNTLAMIRQSGEEPEIIEYLKTPPSRQRLKKLIAAMGIPVRALLREKGTPYHDRRSPKSRKVQYERIGRAYPHSVGEGLTVILDAVPLKGYHIVLLELDEADDRRLLAEARRRRRNKGTSKASWRRLPTQH